MAQDMECENIYEKWLRRRLNYTCIRSIGKHCPPQLVHQMLHEGNSVDGVTSELRRKLWTWSKYPNPDYFSHGIARYQYPQEIMELLKLRFFNSARISESCQDEQLADVQRPFNLGVQSEVRRAADDDGCTDPNVYKLNLSEVAEVPQWKNISHLLPHCPYPHLRETPLSWTMDCDGQDIKEPTEGDGTKPMYPVCCYKDQVCCAIHCRDPIPRVVHAPGSWAPTDIKVLWR